MPAVFQFFNGTTEYSIAKDLIFGWTIDIGNGFTPIDHGFRRGTRIEILQGIKFLKDLERQSLPAYVPNDFKEAVRAEITRVEKLLEVPVEPAAPEVVEEVKDLLRSKDTAVLALQIIEAMKLNADGNLMADLDYVIIVKGKTGQGPWMVTPRDAASEQGFDTLADLIAFILRRWW